MPKKSQTANWDAVNIGTTNSGPTLRVYSKSKTVEFFKSAEAHKNSAAAKDARNALRAKLVERQ
jgi:hypothetical protein